MKNTNARFVQDINRIVKVQQGKQASLSDIQVEPIAPGRGIGEKRQDNLSSGIASPLKELGDQREYYEPEMMTSSDGLFVMEKQAIKKAVFEDRDGEEVVIEFSKLDLY